MKQTQRITIAVLAALTLTALGGVSTASATTLEVGGVPTNAEVAFETTIKSGGSFLLADTSNISFNTCVSSTVKGHTESPFSGTTVGGPVTALSYNSCSEGNPTVNAAGRLTVERIGTTTNGTVRSSGTKITVPSHFGTLTCTTSSTDIGTLTGVKSGNATFDINAVLSCTVIGTVRWSGTYTVTSPTELGVTGEPAPETALEVEGVTDKSEVALEATIASGGSLLVGDTFGATANTCTASTVKGHTESPFTGSTVGGPVTSLSFSSCTEGTPTVDGMGTLSIEHILGTTNGTVRSSNAKVTVPSIFGTLTCTTSNTDIGTLTGVKSGSATLDINAVLSCTVIGTAKWSGTYTVTSPPKLGVTGETAGTAETALEVEGVAKSSEVALEATIASGGSLLVGDTFGATANTCTASTVKGHTESPFTGSTVGGPVTSLSFSSCTEGTPTVDGMGTLSIEHILGTTNGTVRSSKAKVTVPSFFGTMTCTTSNTDIGTLTGVKSGSATLDINAVLSCTVVGTAKWSGTYTVTSPAGLGVTI